LETFAHNARQNRSSIDLLQEVSMRLIIAASLVIGLASSVLADTYAAESWTRDYAFGKTKIVLERDDTRKSPEPSHTLTISRDNEIIAKYQNVGFEQIFASEDKKYFVGLSNSGITLTAFVIFNSEGSLIREMKHEFMPIDIYSEMSVSIVRTWLAEKPEVEFKMKDDRLVNVFVNGSKGKRYDLLKTDLDFQP
jgi:hypothetical protein